MIDPTLSRLAGALRTAEDTLNSEDFSSRQTWLVQLEQEARDTIARIEAEREALAAGLEADEAAYENAQNALTAYIAANYLESVGTNEPDDDDMFEPIRAVEPEDEFSTPRANGAYSEDFTPPAMAD
jgi:hypothetical protein